jgi:hypothetical protein
LILSGGLWAVAARLGKPSGGAGRMPVVRGFTAGLIRVANRATLS